MTFGKTDLMAHVASQTQLTKEQSQQAIEAVFSGITQALKNNQEVRFIGFGSFKNLKTAARAGINPKTMEPIQIAASQRAIFKAGKELKDALNGIEKGTSKDRNQAKTSASSKSAATKANDKSTATGATKKK